jgi:hypothetical protein
LSNHLASVIDSNIKQPHTIFITVCSGNRFHPFVLD